MPVRIGQGRLGAGMQGLGAEEQFRARRVIGERDDVGGVDDPRIGPVVSGLVQGRLPVLLVADPVDHVALAERQGVAGGELHAKAVQVPEELPRGPGTVGADQDLLPGQYPASVVETLRELGCGGVGDPDVVLGAVRPGIAWPQDGGEDFPGSVAGAVIDAGDERSVPVSALIGAGDLFLIRVRGHQGRVDVDDQRIQGTCGQGRVPVPGGLPGPGAQFPGEGLKPVAKQLGIRNGALEKPGHGRVRGQLTEDPG